MKDNPQLVHGSGNTFRDLGVENADALQLKALLGADIVKTLDKEQLSVRAGVNVRALRRLTFRGSGMRISSGFPSTG